MDHKCSEIIEMMHDYIDGILSQEETIIVKQHIESCEACADEYVFMKQMVESLHQIKEVDVPKGLHEEIMERIDEIKKPSRTSRFMKTFKPITSVVAAAFLLFVVFSVLSSYDLLDFNRNRESYDSIESESAATESDEAGSSSHMMMDTAERADIDEEERGNGHEAGALFGMEIPENSNQEAALSMEYETEAIDEALEEAAPQNSDMDAGTESSASDDYVEYESVNNDGEMMDDSVMGNNILTSDAIEVDGTMTATTNEHQVVVEGTEKIVIDEITEEFSEADDDRDDESDRKNELDKEEASDRSGILIPIGVSLAVGMLILLIMKKKR